MCCNPFKNFDLYSMYNSISKVELIYLPNEAQIENISDKVNRFTKNIKFFAVLSESECSHILNNDYGYTENIVHAIGLPKYR